MVSVPMPHDLFAVTAGSVRPQRSSLDQCVDTILAPARSDSADDVATLVAEVVLVALPLAESLARRYHGRGVEPEDLLQVARLGLVKAAQRYRPESPGGFSAYAIPTITGEIKRHFRDHQWLVRPPRAIQDLRRRVADCRGALSQALGRTVTDEEIARELEIDADLVRAVVLAGGAYGATSDEMLAEHPGANGASIMSSAISRCNRCSTASTSGMPGCSCSASSKAGASRPLPPSWASARCRCHASSGA